MQSKIFPKLVISPSIWNKGKFLTAQSKRNRPVVNMKAGSFLSKVSESTSIRHSCSPDEYSRD